MNTLHFSIRGCLFCHRLFTHGRGRPPKYCSLVCKKAAYRSRQIENPDNFSGSDVKPFSDRLPLRNSGIFSGSGDKLVFSLFTVTKLFYGS